METITRNTKEMFIEVRYGLVTIGDQKPYFSVTGSIWANRSAHTRGPDNPHTSGQVHDEVLRNFPDLADLVALHLADIDGVPMHAVANGEYFYRQGNVDAAARTLRVAVEDLPADLSPADFKAYAESQRDRWKSEADAVIEKYALVADVPAA